MLVSFLSALVLNGGQSATPSFGEIEKAKYEAFSAYVGSGKYEVFTLPSAVKQSITFSVGPLGRRVRVTNGETEVAESGWTKDTKWLVNHVTQQYSEVKAEGAIRLVEPYEALKAEKGRANFSVQDMGPRFAADPVPAVVKDEVVTVEGRKQRRIEALAKNGAGDGEIRIVQFFDEGTWITRQFSLEISAGGKSVLRLTGHLREDKKEAPGLGAFAFPNRVIGRYQRVNGQG